MKFLSIIILIILSTTIVYSQSYIDQEKNPQLWGEVNIDQFQEKPYKEWYNKNEVEYTSQLSPNDADLFKDTKVKIFIGTWCGDTKYLFPKFIKSWNQMGLSEDQLEIIALHHEGDLYKQGPNNETEGLSIHRVPTFVFYNKDEELGRIVERTVFDLDTDMKLIATQQPYQHRYKAVSITSELMTNNIDSLNSETFLKTAIKKTSRELSTDMELNTYAYTLLFAGDLQKAKFVFKLNRHLFPFNPYTRYGYGKALFMTEEYQLSKEEFVEAIRIKPEFEKAIEYLYKINEELRQVKN